MFEHHLFYQYSDGDYHYFFTKIVAPGDVQGYPLAVYDGEVPAAQIETILPDKIPEGSQVPKDWLGGTPFTAAADTFLMAGRGQPFIDDQNRDWDNPVELAELIILVLSAVYAVLSRVPENLPEVLQPIQAGGSSGGGGASGIWNWPEEADEWGNLPETGCYDEKQAFRQSYVVTIPGTFYWFEVDPDFLFLWPDDNGEPNHFTHFLEDAVLVSSTETHSRTALRYEFDVSLERATAGGAVSGPPAHHIEFEDEGNGVMTWNVFRPVPCEWEHDPYPPNVIYFPEETPGYGGPFPSPLPGIVTGLMMMMSFVSPSMFSFGLSDGASRLYGVAGDVYPFAGESKALVVTI